MKDAKDHISKTEIKFDNPELEKQISDLRSLTSRDGNQLKLELTKLSNSTEQIKSTNN